MEKTPPPKEIEPLKEEATKQIDVERQDSKLTIEETKEETDAQQAVNKVNEIKDKVKKPAFGCTLVLFLILNIAMFFVGVTTTKDCPKKPIIPIYLAVAGAIGIITKIVPIANRNKQIAILNQLVYLLVLVELIWMILGSYWIYSIYEPSYNPYDGNEYCHKTCYLMAFWLLTLHYIYILILLLIPCCILYACGIGLLCCGQKIIESCF